MQRTSFGCSTAPNRRPAGSRERLRGRACGALALLLIAAPACGALAAPLPAAAGSGGLSSPSPSPVAAPDRIHRAAEIASPAIVVVDESTTGYLVDVRDGSRHGPFTAGGLGTGFFASADGYVVTAGHIAARQDDELKRDLLGAFIAEQNGCGSLDSCGEIIADNIDAYDARTELGEHSSVLHVVTQADRGFDQGELRTAGSEARLVSGSADTERDVAVIKIDGSNEPVLTLADPQAPGQRAAVSLLGYPARTLQPKGQQTSTTPTVTFGRVTGRRSPSQGRDIAPDASLVVTDAQQEEGNSGGPGVDEAGEVLGIVSFGIRDVKGGFMISAGDVADLLRAAGVANRLGEIDHLWRDGLSAFDQRHYRDAAGAFQRCETLNRAQVGCADYRRRAEQLFGQDTGSTGAAAPVAVPPWLPGAVVFGCLALLAGLLVLLRRRRREPAPQPRWAYGPPPAGWWHGSGPSVPAAPPWSPPPAPLPAPAVRGRAPAASPPAPAAGPWPPGAATARFCSRCGASMQSATCCPRCGHIPQP